MGVAAGGDAVNGFRDICETGFYRLPDFREELGPEGPALAQILLRMGRGRLG